MRAMELVAQEKQAAAALSESAAAKMQRVESSMFMLADKERELRLLVEASEAQVGASSLHLGMCVKARPLARYTSSCTHR